MCIVVNNILLADYEYIFLIKIYVYTRANDSIGPIIFQAKYTLPLSPYTV